MWLPIESAPKDGTWVLLTGEGGDYHASYGECWMSIGRFDPGGYNDKWRDQWDDYYGPYEPTHWQPLPEPPQ